MKQLSILLFVGVLLAGVTAMVQIVVYLAFAGRKVMVPATAG